MDLKRYVPIAVLAAFLAGQARAADTVCLDSRNITDSRAKDSHTIIFRMIDGSRWRGTLAQDCPGLNYNGFTMFPADSDRVCAGQQLIRVLQNHQVCRIDTLTPIPPRAP